MEVESSWNPHLVFRLTHDITQKKSGVVVEVEKLETVTTCTMDCFLIHQKKQQRWKYDSDEYEDADEKLLCDFISFVEKKFQLTDVKIFHLKDKNNLNDKESIDIDDADDLVCHLGDAQDAGNNAIYFLIEGRPIARKVSKYQVEVDLTACECDNIVSIKIDKHDFKDETSWNDSWQDLCNEIGTELKDDEWENKYQLISSMNEKQVPMKKLKQFIGIFVNIDANGNNNENIVVSFYVSV